MFTTLDLKNGFLHIPIDKNDCKYSAFVVPVRAEFLEVNGGFSKVYSGVRCVSETIIRYDKKDVNFVFSESQRCTFKKLKNLLCEKPILSLYRPFAKTELHNDASALGLGAILLQRDRKDRLFHPIHYASWKTSKSEEKYDSYKLEVLAVVKALRKFCRPLRGQ